MVLEETVKSMPTVVSAGSSEHLYRQVLGEHTHVPIVARQLNTRACSSLVTVPVLV